MAPAMRLYRHPTSSEQHQLGGGGLRTGWRGARSGRQQARSSGWAVVCHQCRAGPAESTLDMRRCSEEGSANGWRRDSKRLELAHACTPSSGAGRGLQALQRLQGRLVLRHAPHRRAPQARLWGPGGGAAGSHGGGARRAQRRRPRLMPLASSALRWALCPCLVLVHRHLTRSRQRRAVCLLHNLVRRPASGRQRRSGAASAADARGLPSARPCPFPRCLFCRAIRSSRQTPRGHRHDRSRAPFLQLPATAAPCRAPWPTKWW